MSYSNVNMLGAGQPPATGLSPFSPFNVAQPFSSTLPSSTSTLGPPPYPPFHRTRANSTAGFQAPAHKHAHHLHSIPPREKSTRTLIIDHMLWVHGRTRLAQARAELGMTDRTGGPSSENYAHRERPENFEEDNECPSDGEDVMMLKSRSGGPGHPRNDDEETLRKQDLSLARNLRVRAEGVEKVVTSMLNQPPAVHPIDDEDLLGPPTSPPMKPQGDSSHPHTLPNGVRLRLALGTVINDLFARQAPPPPHRHHHEHSVLSSSDSPILNSSAMPLDESLSSLPVSLLPLWSISRISITGNGNMSAGTMPPLAGSDRQSASLIPTPRVRAMYATGVSSSFPPLAAPTRRCPRHLHTGCEICVDARLGGRTSGTGGVDRRKSQATASGSGGGGGGGISGWLDGIGIGGGLGRPAIDGSALRRKSGDGRMENPTMAEMIPRFLRLSALVATELGIEARDEEMGERDWVETEDERDRGTDKLSANILASPGSVRTSSSGNNSQAKTKSYTYVLRPTKEWYMLLTGLLTRAVLEGYATCAWKGTEAVECLLMVGQGMVGGDREGKGLGHSEAKGQFHREGYESGDDAFAQFDPDEMPSVQEAARVLFPALRNAKGANLGLRGEGAEADFEAEMEDRLRKFFDIPASTLDLATHMEDIALKYPAEPVERAAVRFCEAVAKWRGKPELETYKKNPPRSSLSTGGSAMTIDSLVHSNPTSPTMTNLAPPPPPLLLPKLRRPSIETYFTQPPSLQSSIGINKRQRSPEDPRLLDNIKRFHG